MSTGRPDLSVDMVQRGQHFGELRQRTAGSRQCFSVLRLGVMACLMAVFSSILMVGLPEIAQAQGCGLGEIDFEVEDKVNIRIAISGDGSSIAVVRTGPEIGGATGHELVVADKDGSNPIVVIDHAIDPETGAEIPVLMSKISIDDDGSTVAASWRPFGSPLNQNVAVFKKDGDLYTGPSLYPGRMTTGEGNLSGDGKKLLLENIGSEGWIVRDLDGGDSALFATNGRVSVARLSGDGSALAFFRRPVDGGNRELAIGQVATEVISRVILDVGVFPLAISEDGLNVMYGDTGGQVQLAGITTAGQGSIGSLTRISPNLKIAVLVRSFDGPSSGDPVMGAFNLETGRLAGAVTLRGSSNGIVGLSPTTNGKTYAFRSSIDFASPESGIVNKLYLWNACGGGVFGELPGDAFGSAGGPGSGGANDDYLQVGIPLPLPYTRIDPYDPLEPYGAAERLYCAANVTNEAPYRTACWANQANQQLFIDLLQADSGGLDGDLGDPLFPGGGLDGPTIWFAETDLDSGLLPAPVKP